MEAKSNHIIEETGLPNPYGAGFERGDTWRDGLALRSEQHEQRRFRWSKFIQHPLFNAWRIGGPLILSLLYLVPLLISTEQSVRIWLICTAALLVTLPRMPTLVTLEWTWHSAVDHLELIRRDEAHEAARPGAARMLEELDDRRNMQRLHLNLGLIAFVSAFVAVLQEQISLGPQLLLVSASIIEMVLFIQPYLLRNWGLIPDAKHPMLSIYRPCQRTVLLSYPLTDVIETHLDPWTKREWSHWRESFHEKFKSSKGLGTPEQGLEYLLLLEHLHLRRTITKEQLDSKLTIFKNHSLGNSDRPDIEYFLLHIYGQCPGLVQLIDKMLDSLITPIQEIEGLNQTIDAIVQRRDTANSADLLVRVTNHDTDSHMMTLRAFSDDATPHSHTFTLDLDSSTILRKEYPLFDSDSADAIDTIPTLIQQSKFLWITLAWPTGSWKNRTISLELESESGESVFKTNLEVPVPHRKSMLWFKALTRIERLASQGGLIPL